MAALSLLILLSIAILYTALEYNVKCSSTKTKNQKRYPFGSSSQHKTTFSTGFLRQKNCRSSEEGYTENGMYSNLFVFQASNDKELRKYLKKYGFSYIRRIFPDEDFYLFNHSSVCRRCRRNMRQLKMVSNHSMIQWASQQTLFHRVQRSKLFGHSISGSLSTPSHKALLIKELLQPSNVSNGLKFNDPLFKEQWYLRNVGEKEARDINVFPAWQRGVTGRGVRIAVLDDGIYRRSPEVAKNYDEAASEEFLYLNFVFKAIPENSHGTYCAAIAAGVANNQVCGVGVAYDAKIVGVRILNGPLTDAQEAIALVHALEVVDIYTASWGPDDRGNAIGGPGPLTRKAILKGVTKGRHGKGAIYVWAAGNGGAYLDSCNLDGYASSPFTVTVGALGPEGRSAFYSEHCAAVLASVYVGGPHYPPSKENLEKERQKTKVVVPEGRGKCRQTFQGTSAAAPLAAGAIALLLQANPTLGWRDVQHIILNTCRIPFPEEPGWLWNAAGFHFHPKIGCGALDVDRMVETAMHWKPVGRLKTWTSPPLKNKRILLARANTFLVASVHTSSMHPLDRINRLETVVATVDIINLQCGHLEMSLTSPMGTRSEILTRRPYDNKTTRFPYWDFTSLHFWGEDPEGEWLFKVSNHGPENGLLNYFSLTFYGTEENQQQLLHTSRDSQTVLDV